MVTFVSMYTMVMVTIPLCTAAWISDLRSVCYDDCCAVLHPGPPGLEVLTPTEAWPGQMGHCTQQCTMRNLRDNTCVNI